MTTLIKKLNYKPIISWAFKIFANQWNNLSFKIGKLSNNLVKYIIYIRENLVNLYIFFHNSYYYVILL